MRLCLIIIRSRCLYRCATFVKHIQCLDISWWQILSACLRNADLFDEKFDFLGCLLSNPVTFLPVTLFHFPLFFSRDVVIVSRHKYGNDHLSDKIYFCIASKQRFLTNLQLVTSFILKEKSCLPNILPMVYWTVCGSSVQPTLDWNMCILYTLVNT